MTELQEKIFRKRISILEKQVEGLLDIVQQMNPPRVNELRKERTAVKTQLLQMEEVNSGERHANRAP